MKKSTKRKIKKLDQELTTEILLTLRELSLLVPRPFDSGYMLKQRLRNYDRYGVSRALWDLKRQGLVKKIEKKRKIYYDLTNLGQAKALKFSFLRKPKQAKTNGLSTLIIFDIPEEKRKARQFLRRFLVQNGYTMLQRSVFIGRWEINQEFKGILKELKIDSNVSILEGRILYT